MAKRKSSFPSREIMRVTLILLASVGFGLIILLLSWMVSLRLYPPPACSMDGSASCLNFGLKSYHIIHGLLGALLVQIVAFRYFK